MKRHRRFLGSAALLAACALILTSCEFRVHTDLVIEEDESGVLSLELSVDDQLAELAESGMGMDMGEAVGEGGEGIGELIGEEWVPEGWTIESVSGDYQGIRASIEFENFDQLRQRMAGLSGMEGVDVPMSTGMLSGIALERDGSAFGMLSDISLERDGSAFMFRLAIPEQPEDMFDGMTEDSPMPIDPAMLEDIFDIRFTLTLPGEIVADRTNADLITGQTLVWNLSLDDGRVLEAQSQLPGSGAGTIIVWAVAALVLVAAGYVWYDRRRRAAAVSAEEPELPESADVEEDSSEDD